MSSAFAQLPTAVLSEIFWLTPFLDTLRCEQVCRSWQSVLNRSSATSEDLFPTWSPGIWGNELELLVVKTEKEQEKPALKLQQFINRRSIAITLLVSRRDSTFFGEVFFKWLTEHAAGFLRIRVHKTVPQSSWLFARTVLAIGIASLSAPPLFTISFDTDLGVMQSPSFCELLGNRTVSWSSNSTAELAELQPLTSLTRLTDLCVRDGTNLGDMTELRHLHHLDSLTVRKVSALASKVPNFNNLQFLSLSDCPDEIWDFSSCSSLVNLRISSFADTMKQVVLPSGPEVMLQDLSVETMSQDMHDFVMVNISKATHLTEVAFTSAYPSNFRDGGWPLHLPNLRKLRLTGLSCDLPSAVTSCPNLQHFAVTDYDQSTLPLWLSSMTQLTCLRIHSGMLKQFPEQVLQLSQLRSLLVSLMCETNFVLPRVLLCCAEWPDLTTLHIDVGQDNVPLESQLVMLQLELLIKLQNAGCEVRFD